MDFVCSGGLKVGIHHATHVPLASAAGSWQRGRVGDPASSGQRHPAQLRERDGTWVRSDATEMSLRLDLSRRRV